MTKDALRIPGIVLLVSMILSLCGIIKSEGVLRDILVNLFVTIIGILATVFLINRVIEEDAERKRHRILQTAFQRLPLKGQLSLFMSIGQSTSPEGEIKNYSDLYDEKYYEYLKRLDFSSKGPGRWNTGKDMNWGEYITFSCSEFKESISIIIGNYNIYLKPEEIETFQSILDSDYMNFAVKVIPLLLTSNLKLTDPHLFDVKDYNGTKQYLNLLRQLAEIFNSYCKEGDAINF